jgi:hypothetical protein
MDIKIPKVVVAVDMEDYHPDLKGKCLHVWVNPPLDVLQKYTDIQAELDALLLADVSALLPHDGEKEKFSALDVLKEYLGIKRKRPIARIDAKLLEWYVVLWSQGPQDAKWSVKELQDLELKDNAFVEWMIAATWSARKEHIERKKKA